MSEAADNNPCLTPVTGHITLRDPYLEEQLKRKGAGFCVQFQELLARSWRMFLRDPGNFYGRIVETVFMAIFLGLFFFNIQISQTGVQDRMGVFYVLMIFSLFNAAMKGIASFPPERAVFLQEQANDTYNAYIYYLAKNVAELPWQFLFPTVLQVFVYFMAHLVRNVNAFFVNWFLIVLISNLGYSIGLMLATFFKDAQAAFALTPIIFLPLFTVSGMFANTDRLYP